MEKSEAKSAVKAVYLQAAALAGMEVGPQSPERFVQLVERGFEKVEVKRRAKAVASVLRVIAETLELAEEHGVKVLGESNVDAAKERLCPIYPFGSEDQTRGQSGKKLRSRK